MADPGVLCRNCLFSEAWSARRQGEALSREQVADKVAEAEWRERETGRQLHVAFGRGSYGGDPRELAEQ